MDENEWLRFRAASFDFIYLDLMRNHSFSTLTMAISPQCCINNQNIHNTHNHMSIVCLWWYAELLAKRKIK